MTSVDFLAPTVRLSCEPADLPLLDFMAGQRNHAVFQSSLQNARTKQIVMSFRLKDKQ